MAKHKIAVIVHPDAAPLIQQTFGRYLRNTGGVWHFLCDKVDASGPLMELTLPEQIPGIDARPVPAVLRIQYGFLIGSLEFPGDDPVGFIGSKS